MTEADFKRIEKTMAYRFRLMEESPGPRLDLLAEGQQMLGERMDRMEERLESVETRLTTVEGKVDGIAADLSAHRADTEAYRPGYRGGVGGKKRVVRAEQGRPGGRPCSRGSR